MVTNSAAALMAALGELAALGAGRDRERITALQDRLEATRLRVLVAGEAKRGKSTLINALLDRRILPSGVTPLTAVATTVRYGDDPCVVARFADGHEEKHLLPVLPELVTERGNPGNRRGIADVTVFLDAAILAGGVELVDTPGTGSVFEWDTAAAHIALEAMDAAVFVLTADPPVSAAERDLLAKVGELSVTTFVVLNKTDHLDAEGLAEAEEFTRQVTAVARVYPMSARAALDGWDPGFEDFAADFREYLASKRVSDLQTAAVAQARRIARALLDEVAVTRRAAQLRAGEASDRVHRFGDRLSEVIVRGRDAVIVVNGQSKHLLAALNDAAAADPPRLIHDIGADVDAMLDGELRGASPADIEQRGRSRLVELTLAAVAAWRDQRRDEIERGLAQTDARLATGLSAALNILRESAAELLGLDLMVPGPGERLAEDRRFFFTTAEETGQTELLAGAIRRALLGELGRRQARAHVRAEVPRLVAVQVGRARGDLQYRLQEATRALAREVERRYVDATERIGSALITAAEIGELSAADAARKEQELTAREATLRRVTELLGQAR